MNETTIQDPRVARLYAAAAEFLAAHGEHEFANHGDEHTYGGFVTLAQLADGNIARNNCYIASEEIAELLGNEAFGAESMHTIAVANEDIFHAVLAVYVDDEEWYVIDFTARQFDEHLPFPYIAEQSEWKRTIDWAADGFTGFCKDASDPSSFEEEDYWD
jgi:hypothetical protein